MFRLLFALSLAVAVSAQTAPTPSERSPALARILDFEAEPSGTMPGGWRSATPNNIAVDEESVHSGKRSVRLERNAGDAGTSAILTASVPLDFDAKVLTLHGFLRTAGVTQFAGFWMREDGYTPNLAFDNMQARHVTGTTDWTEYTVTLPFHPDARTLYFGVLLVGEGKAWADGLELRADGKPIWEPSKVERPKTAIEQDTEFNDGSKIAISSLTPSQVENLGTLGKVWGFLKYHHPLVTAGKRHWDYDLFRVMPKVVAAPDRVQANTVMVEWIRALGPVAPCSPCARLEESGLHLRPEIAWIDNQAALGKDLSALLRSIYAARPANGKQFYVSLNDGIGNPSFDHELPYSKIKAPDAGYQILSVYRLWNIIRYWYPYRDVLGENWDGVLAEFLPRVGLAKDDDSYQRETMALIARIHDTHANLWSSMRVRPPEGVCQLPIDVRFVDQSPVVATAAAGLQPGDVILSLDGQPVATVVAKWLPYYAASNEPTRLRDLGRSFSRGNCGEISLTVDRAGEKLELKATRVPINSIDTMAWTRHDHAGPTFQKLPGDIAYMKLSSIKAADVKGYIDSAAGTKGLIIDIRNYPSEFVVFALGSLLVSKPTEFARFTSGDLANPGAFHFGPAVSLKPAAPHYAGKIMILVDEVSQSQAEYTTMAFRSVPGAKVIGSTTAGADGNVSSIPLPGNLRSMISGIGVFYPDKRPTQRVGILADVEVKATLKGIREGRDEVLEEAVRQILGVGR